MIAKSVKQRVGGWMEQRFAEPVRIMIAAILIGIGAGAITAALKYSIEKLTDFLTSGLLKFDGNWQYLLFPFIAIFGGLLWQKLVRQNLAHSTEQLRSHVHSGELPFKRSHIFTPVIGCLITVGFGGSAGGEGPSAFSGAALGARLGTWFRLSPDSVKILFGAGAAAGIAGIFKSPVGGVLFTFEILGMELAALGFAAVVASALTAFCTSYALSGFTWDLPLLHQQDYVPQNIGWIILLGVFCGLYSVYYRRTQQVATRFFESQKRQWVGALIFSIALGVSTFLLPLLFGEGYGTVTQLVNGTDSSLFENSLFSRIEMSESGIWIMLLGVVAVLLLKGFAVGGTNSSGGVAGEFAPTIFSGALCGYLFATCANMWFAADLPVESFALIGGASVMAGAIKAPLMAIFIGAEISDRYNLILPFILVCGFSWLVVYLCESAPSRSRGSSPSRTCSPARTRASSQPRQS